MAKYTLKEDFYLGTSKLGAEDKPLFKKGQIIDTKSEDFVSETDDGLIFRVNDEVEQMVKNILIPFNSIKRYYSQTNTAIIIFGIGLIGFISYKLIKKYT